MFHRSISPFSNIQLQISLTICAPVESLQVVVVQVYRVQLGVLSGCVQVLELLGQLEQGSTMKERPITGHLKGLEEGTRGVILENERERKSQVLGVY